MAHHRVPSRFTIGTDDPAFDRSIPIYFKPAPFVRRGYPDRATEFIPYLGRIECQAVCGEISLRKALAPSTRDLDQALALAFGNGRVDQPAADTKIDQLVIGGEQPAIFQARVAHMLDQQKFGEANKVDRSCPPSVRCQQFVLLPNPGLPLGRPDNVVAAMGMWFAGQGPAPLSAESLALHALDPPDEGGLSRAERRAEPKDGQAPHFDQVVNAAHLHAQKSCDLVGAREKIQLTCRHRLPREKGKRALRRH